MRAATVERFGRFLATLRELADNEAPADRNDLGMYLTAGELREMARELDPLTASAAMLIARRLAERLFALRAPRPSMDFFEWREKGWPK